MSRWTLLFLILTVAENNMAEETGGNSQTVIYGIPPSNGQWTPSRRSNTLPALPPPPPPSAVPIPPGTFPAPSPDQFEWTNSVQWSDPARLQASASSAPVADPPAEPTTQKSWSSYEESHSSTSISTSLRAPSENQTQVPWRTDPKTGVLAFSRIMIFRFRTGKKIILESTRYRVTTQRYKFLWVWSCQLLVTVHDKALNKVVDYVKVPCVEDKDISVTGGIIRVGTVVYSCSGEQMMFMVRGGCIIREYVLGDNGKVEKKDLTLGHELNCMRMILGDTNDQSLNG